MEKTTNTVYYRITSLLNKNNIPYKEIKHPPEGETVRVSQLRGNDLSQAAKAMVIQLKLSKKEKLYYLTVIPGDRRLDFEKIRNLNKAQKVMLAPKEKAEILTECEMGTVPPFSFNNELPLLVDPSLKENKEIIFNAGQLDCSIKLEIRHYLNLTKPKIVEIT
ncbi:YbaK/EbsC family protein [Scopulibacillus cellulosilyticus]|uniref:YbaK/EbsC family protein n=1 Tax=Scopulibacillus cellulosilyticus TaxID=2665665 RepID=A0ABW2Q0H9_9BACL